MRKKYLHNKYGTDDEFWDSNWRGTMPPDPLVDGKLVRYINRYMLPGSLMLEGGCGNGNYVRFFSGNGIKVVGIDFASKTVACLNELFPHLSIRKGNIFELEFEDSYFDAYYSGGVIEHFESGVDVALKEAARVLKEDGLFFVTVPHMNVARRLSVLAGRERFVVDLDDREAFFRESVKEFSCDIPPEGYHFHEYEFQTDEVRWFLRQHGFRIIKEVPFSTMWGIRDLQCYRKLAGIGSVNPTLLNKIVRRLVRLTEYIDNSPGKIMSFLSTIQGCLFGNLKLYICASKRRNQS